MEALSLELLQEVLLPPDLPGISLGAAVSHEDVIPPLRGLGLEDKWGWGWHRAQAKGGAESGWGPGGDSPPQARSPSAGSCRLQS